MWEVHKLLHGRYFLSWILLYIFFLWHEKFRFRMFKHHYVIILWEKAFKICQQIWQNFNNDKWIFKNISDILYFPLFIIKLLHWLYNYKSDVWKTGNAISIYHLIWIPKISRNNRMSQMINIGNSGKCNISNNFPLCTFLYFSYFTISMHDIMKIIFTKNIKAWICKVYNFT